MADEPEERPVWIYEEGEQRLRLARPDELHHGPVDVSKIKVGDIVTVRMTHEELVRLLEVGPIADALALPVGRAFLAWTSACACVLGLFSALTRLDAETAETIFGRVRSDKTQRDLVLDVAMATAPVMVVRER